MENSALKLIHDKNAQFLFLFNNADVFYIASRYCLHNGLAAAGYLNAHQAIELYIKAIFRLDNNLPFGHNLIKLLDKYKTKDIFFTKVLKESIYSEFLKELSDSYISYRYGKAGSISNPGKIIKILDEIVYNLRNIYIKNIKYPSNKLYVPNDVKSDFLKDNNFFQKEDLSDGVFARMGIPIE